QLAQTLTASTRPQQQQQQQRGGGQWQSEPDSPTPTAAWCQACLQPIADRYFLQVGDCLYHSGCLRCQQCQRCLETAGSCFAKEGKIFCRDDYYNLFSARQSCTRCGGCLHPADLVMKAREHHFHLGCFTCHWPACDRRFSPGDEFGLSLGGAVFCRLHLQHQQHLPPPPPLLPPPPPPQFLLSDSLETAEAATAAAKSATQSEMGGGAGGKQASRAGKGRPRKSKKLAEPPATSQATQHPVALHQPHSQPDELGIVQQPHLQLQHQIACGFSNCIVKEELPMTASTAETTPTTVTLASTLAGDAMDSSLVDLATVQGSAVFGVGGDPLEQLGSEMASDACCQSPNSASSGCGGVGGGGGGSLVAGDGGDGGVGGGSSSVTSGTPGQRQKRVRTSFKHHQLRTMKSYFIINHNPDSKDLKQLAQKTGLSKRVLQVWFQNARAKYRRSLLKQQQQQQQPQHQQQLQQQQQPPLQPPDEAASAAHAAMLSSAAAGHQKSASL
uniref:LIM/homeobox protein Lhx9 n=1 Tax=Macrostomum lignano TaxID=282301 RepID=A0A1I8JC63_9PLAT